MGDAADVSIEIAPAADGEVAIRLSDGDGVFIELTMTTASWRLFRSSGDVAAEMADGRAAAAQETVH